MFFCFKYNHLLLLIFVRTFSQVIGSDSFQTEKRFLTKKEKRKAAKPENFGELYKEKIKSLPKEQQVKLMGEELKAIKGKIAHVRNF